MAVGGDDRQVGAPRGDRAVEAEQGEEEDQRIVLHQRQPEVRGYRSQALFLVPTAGAVQTSISTVSVTVRDTMAMRTGFTSDSGALEVDRVADQRAGHAVAAAAAAAEFGADDGDDLDSGLAEQGIGAGVAVVGEHHAG